MKNMSLEKIAQACGGVYHGSEEMKQSIVESITTDSRQAAKGCLFVAIPGERVDGHDFIPSVFEKGALAVLSEKELENPAGPYIQVASSLEAVKGIAEYYRQQLDIKVVGITGSVGKTSTKEVIASVLAQKYNVLKTLGNFNNELGLPLTVFRLRDGHQPFWRDASSCQSSQTGYLRDHQYRTVSSGVFKRPRRYFKSKDGNL